MAVEDEKMTDAEPEAEPEKVQPKGKKKKTAKELADAELSEEDLEIKNNLELLVERIKDSDAEVQKFALETISQEIRTATTSMTAVPKPLKFLRPHYDVLKQRFESLPAGENKHKLADVISVLAITTGKEGERESLKFRLLGSTEDVGGWGHEYVRNLAGEDLSFSL